MRTPSPPATATATLTPAASPSPAPPTATPGRPTTYTVQRGDTLYSIARRFGTTVAALVAANHLADPDQIYTGQVLVIPDGNVILPTVTPVPGASAQVIRRGPSDRNVVALTFDAGADTGYAAQILDTLAANQITAAFGMTGQWAERNPALLQRMVNEGHELINHTYDHGSFTGSSTSSPPLTQSQRWDELDRTEAIVQEIAGATTKPYFRPPYGDYDASVNADVYARGYRYNVMWTVDSQGWNGLSADQIVQRCLSQAQAGAIYIFHAGSASQDAAALQRVIDGLRAAGYGFVPLSAFAPR